MSKTISFLRFPLICIVVFIHTDLSDIHMAGRQIVAAGEYVGYETFRHFLQLLFLLAVPAFFAISGYLFFNWQGKFTKDVYVRKIGKRVRTLLVPYLLWNLIVWAVNTLGPLLLPSLAAGRGATLADYDLPRFLMAFWDNGGGKPVCIQLWFLRDLIVTCLVSPVIYYGLAHGKHWLLLLLAALFATDILPSVPGLNIAAIFPFALGAWWRRETLTLANNETLNTKHETLNQVSDKCSNVQASERPSVQATIALGVVYIALVSFVTFFVEEKRPIRLMRLSILLGLPLLFAIASRLSGFQWKKPVAQSTFFVYGSHLILLSFLERHIVCAIPRSDLTLSIAYLLIPLLVISLCVAASVCLQRLCRPVWLALTGFR